MLVSFLILPLILITNTAEPFLGLGVVFLLSTAGWGLGTLTIWQFNSGVPWNMFDMAIAAVPGFIASFAAAWIVTVLTAPPGDAITVQFDRVRAGPLEVPAGA